MVGCLNLYQFLCSILFIAVSDLIFHIRECIVYMAFQYKIFWVHLNVLKCREMVRHALSRYSMWQQPRWKYYIKVILNSDSFSFPAAGTGSINLPCVDHPDWSHEAGRQVGFRPTCSRTRWVREKAFKNQSCHIRQYFYTKRLEILSHANNVVVQMSWKSLSYFHPNIYCMF